MLLNMMRVVKVAVLIFLPIAILFGFGLLMSRPYSDAVQESKSTLRGEPRIAASSALRKELPVVRGESKSDNGERGVTVIAEFSEFEGKLVFNVAIDTHSVDLSAFNPNTQINLESDDGIAIPAERVESSGSGHHQEFTLYFSKVKGNVRLVVRDLAGVPRREIVWLR
ncbi:MAG: hypothetical protein UX68_C0011G0023 [Parcubacteria group bacterium GW2011_GWA2_46_9]|nr:MAG: hypothetical protein UX68_C0011G0023 [Parcubacteria group bacterium GW2011_GWA2_46_9]